jgi:predicted RecB family nuclease
MQRTDNGLLYSATDLCRHLECPHLTTLACLDLETPLDKDKPDEESELIMAKGLEHELRYLDYLKSQGKSIIDLSEPPGTYEQRLEATRQALKSEPEVIYQAFLYDQPFLGYADFLVRVEKPSELGQYSYEVLDTKLARHPKPYYIIQLCLYSQMIAALQGTLPDHIHVTLGDQRRVSFLLKDYYHYFHHLKREFIRHIEEKPATYPDPCSNCNQCVFRTICETQRLEDDHLSQVAKIRKSQTQRLSTVNVTTMAGLAECKLDHIKGINDETLVCLKRQALLQVHKRTTGKDKHILLQPSSNTKGLHMLPESDAGDLFFDIEGDPLYPDGLEYLFGVYYFDGEKEKFLDLWSHSHSEEKRSFELLIAFFIERLKKYPSMHIYHYAPYEDTALKRLMSKYGTMEAEVDHLLRQKVLVDLYKIVRHSIQISEPSYSLKNLERFYMKKREAEITNAGASIVYYEKFIATKAQKYLDDIKTYNLDDCRSLFLLQGWLGEIKKSAKLDIPIEEPQRENFEDRENPHLEQLKQFEKSLISYLPENEADYTPEQRLDKLVFDIADFYRREAKPSWWRMFSRQTMTTEELIEDAECIGGLHRLDAVAPFQEKRSTIYTYIFPEQEYKFKEGDGTLIAESLESAGTIYSLDQNQCLIQLKRGTAKGPLPDSLNIIPPGPIDTGSLKEALWRFIGAYIEAKKTRECQYTAILDFLNRRTPRVRGVKTGNPLFMASPVDRNELISITHRLQESYLFIQGPPGTGKTYTASHLILELMKNGKKVGVTANSHKVIHNLLRAVEARADEAGFNFVGIKKTSWSSSETIYDGKYIENIDTNDDVFAALDRFLLVAGTAWLFSSLGETQCLDYLFIDEAGQLSLANFIAAGTSAKNIILIGDQMQLAQPTQGVHPGDSGQSVLDFLLQGRHTIPVEEGILLETTYRMHPQVCRFISDAIYDGRIRSLPGLENQAIIQNGKETEKLPTAGLTCHFVDSSNSVQRSDEEAEHIMQIYKKLLRLRYRDKSGNVHPLTSENILIVSPYNMQVNNLKRVLGDQARVGTVDKFQGQEAEVVIVSMATSSPEDIPRGIDFLYSQNRLNVALSRAKTLSILVMSPQLLGVRCNTIEQMRLVNTLCWAKAYGSINPSELIIKRQ